MNLLEKMLKEKGLRQDSRFDFKKFGRDFLESNTI